VKQKLKCSKCGYEWETRSKLKYVSCPSCLSKVEKREKIGDTNVTS